MQAMRSEAVRSSQWQLKAISKWPKIGTDHDNHQLPPSGSGQTDERKTTKKQRQEETPDKHMKLEQQRGTSGRVAWPADLGAFGGCPPIVADPRVVTWKLQCSSFLGWLCLRTMICYKMLLHDELHDSLQLPTAYARQLSV